jgi:hypothetical protein
MFRKYFLKQKRQWLNDLLKLANYELKYYSEVLKKEGPVAPSGSYSDVCEARGFKHAIENQLINLKL